MKKRIEQSEHSVKAEQHKVAIVFFEDGISTGDTTPGGSYQPQAGIKIDDYQVPEGYSDIVKVEFVEE